MNTLRTVGSAIVVGSILLTITGLYLRWQDAVALGLLLVVVGVGAVGVTVRPPRR